MSEELSITNVDDQGNITYGTNSIIQNTAAPKVQTWGFDSIALIQNTGEGIISGLLPGGETGYLTSRTLVRTVDLLAEGEIEGLVSGEYVPVIDDNDPDLAGQLGWKTRPEFVPHANDKSPEKFLRSIYLNDTPIVSAAGYYNFQNVEVAFSNGTPSGIRDGNPFLNVGESNEIQKTRVINSEHIANYPNEHNTSIYF